MLELYEIYYHLICNLLSMYVDILHYTLISILNIFGNDIPSIKQSCSVVNELI